MELVTRGAWRLVQYGNSLVVRRVSPGMINVLFWTKYAIPRVRVELTTLALSAPRPADWANGPIVINELEIDFLGDSI